MSKPRSPRGVSFSSSTVSTCAPAGPRLHHATIDSTRSRGPSKTASTEPSRAFRTQPERPRDRARAAADCRKPTPWTRPRMRTCTRSVSAPAEPLLADERDEAARHRAEDRRPLRRADDHLQLLLPAAPDRDDEPAAKLQLVDERLRRPRRGGGDRDRGIRSVLGEAAAAVSDVNVHAAGVPGRREALTRAFGQRRDALDRVHLRSELGDDGGLVAGAGADVEHALAAVQPELLADARDHVRLRDRLTLPDRYCRVVVRTRPQSLRHEHFARYARHRREHALVVDTARAQLILDHRLPLSEHRGSGRALRARSR